MAHKRSCQRSGNLLQYHSDQYSPAGIPEAEQVAKCLPIYLPLMQQLRLLPPSRQVELVMLLSSQPRLMATLALASPSTHQAVQEIAAVPEPQMQAVTKV